MSGTLRHVALTVEQTGLKAYAWLLIEAAGGKVFVLKRAARTFSNYLGALDAGYQELALLSACGLHERGIEHSPGKEPPPRELELAALHDAL